MNEFIFENQGTNTYLVYAISPDDVVDTMSLGMLTNNKIPGLATTHFTQMDATKYIKYNVSAKISVKQFFAGAVNKKRLLGVFKGIVNALLSAEDYMIDENTILLDLDYIFADVSSCETVLVCLPIQRDAYQLDLGAFFKGIMFSTQFDQTENCDHVARIINYLNSTPLFSLSDFRDLLDKIEQNNIVNNTVPVAEQPIAKPVQPKVEMQVQTPVQTPISKPVSSPVNKPAAVADAGVVDASHQSQAKPSNEGGQPASKQTGNTGNEKNISMFGLLMHYSKENAELYKAQKTAKKNATSAPIVQQSTKKAPQTNFAVPGGNNAGFAIPGQAAPYQTAQPSVQTAHQVQKANPVHQVQQQTANPVPQQPAYVPRQIPQGQGANFGETTVLGGGAIGETTVLTAANNPAQMIAPHIIRSKNNEKISLNKPVFRIGKERSYVDYFIGDNTAISRSHANFITREREYFVVDTNSTNHTFVNGEMIQSNVEVNISHGDTIRLANEDFEFRLY